MLEYKQLGNTAVKPEPIYEPEFEQEFEQQYLPTQKQPPVQKNKISPNNDIPLGLKVKVITRVFLVTFLALLMVARFAAVSIANIGLEEAKQAVQEQQAKNSDLESILAGSMQLDTIQDKAMALGMSFPSSDQMVYVNIVPYSDLVQKNSVDLDNSQKSILNQIID